MTGTLGYFDTEIFTLGLFWMPFIVLGGYGFDTERIARLPEQAFGQQVVVRSGTAAPLVPLEPLARHAAAAWGEDRIAFIRVEMPGDANSVVTVQRTAGGSVIGDAMNFDGATGEYIGTTSGVPNAALGFAGAMIGLHEGLFASPFLRWLYFLSGLLGSAMIATRSDLLGAETQAEDGRSRPGAGLSIRRADERGDHRRAAGGGRRVLLGQSPAARRAGRARRPGGALHVPGLAGMFRARGGASD
ncbi:MAG: PepSY domain-containing protein [Acidobacteria bacterium]|nr:PepSY domain-containing protein [Acidobacteriota bacterium]